MKVHCPEKPEESYLEKIIKSVSHKSPETRKENSSQYRKVTGITWHTPEIFEIRFARGEFDFTPGDCVSIFTEDGETSRPYSIASGTREKELGFIIRKMDDGVVTTYLSKRQPGDRVEISLPYGWFRPGQNINGSPFIFIATGTGVVPFLSYLKSFPQNPPAFLLYGVRNFHDAIYWNALREQCPTRLAISREKTAEHHHGRVTDLLDFLPVSPETHFYLCGLDAMIDEVSTRLENNGTDLLHIHREVFFHAPH